mmetsp:Transcript_366/g.611  ORF Transcript_366/g.611 Transcript_366/m.611 type:complete len:224 (-) Transcript_366:1151-1822(-)
MSSDQSQMSAPSSDVVARRLLESFLEDVNEFARSGNGLLNCTEGERRALNDLMAERYLTEGIDKLQPSPIVKKIQGIISDFIHNKCRALEFCVTERVKEEKSCIATTSWTCQVCGKQHDETLQEKILRACLVCGRNRNYKGSKKTQQLNKLRIDPTPLSTIASKRCLREAQKSSKHSSCPTPPNNVFATKADFEELQRCQMRSEINDVIKEVRSIMGGIMDQS